MATSARHVVGLHDPPKKTSGPSLSAGDEDDLLKIFLLAAFFNLASSLMNEELLLKECLLMLGLITFVELLRSFQKLKRIRLLERNKVLPKSFKIGSQYAKLFKSQSSWFGFRIY